MNYEARNFIYKHCVPIEQLNQSHQGSVADRSQISPPASVTQFFAAAWETCTNQSTADPPAPSGLSPRFEDEWTKKCDRLPVSAVPAGTFNEDSWFKLS